MQEKGLIAPLGVAVFNHEIWVSQPPELIKYSDVDRNLKLGPAVDTCEVAPSGFNDRRL